MNECSFNWVHLECNIEKEKFNPYMLNFLNMFPSVVYFDRFDQKDSYKIKFHIKKKPSYNYDIEEIKKLISHNSNYPLINIADFNLKKEISELFFGNTSEKVYLDFSLASMKCIKNWLNQIENKKTNTFSIVFNIMILYILNPYIKSLFLCPKGDDSLPLPFLSFRSHSDGYFTRMNKENEYRQRMEGIYQANRTEYIQKFFQLIENNKNGLFTDDQSGWTELLNNLIHIARKEISRKNIFFHEEPGYIAENYNISYENFHIKTYKDKIISNYIRKDNRMKVLRLVTGLMYLTIHRLGLSYLERNYLCYSISRTVEDAFNINIDHALCVWRNAIATDQVAVTFK